MAKCKNCGEDGKTWLQNKDTGKWQLLNADGSRHYCMGAGTSTGGQQMQQPQQQQQQPQRQQEASIPTSTLADIVQILQYCEKIAQQVERQAIFYEGLVGEMQTISRSVHKAFLIADKVDQFMQQAKITDAKIDRLVARFTREDKLATQEEEYDRDKEDGTLGLA